MELTLSGPCSLKASPDVIEKIKSELTFANPKYEDAVAFGNSNYIAVPPYIWCYDVQDGEIFFPRGYLDRAYSFSDMQFRDKRLELNPISLTFTGTLRPYQVVAVADILKVDHGVLEAGTGAGKTVMALSIIAERRQPTLILVHTKELLYQWQERIRTFLNIDAGLYGAGKKDLQPVTVAIINTAKKDIHKIKNNFGHVVIDECHRCPSTMFTDVLWLLPARYITGLSATPYRRDRLTRLIYLYCGDRQHKVNQAMLFETGAILRPEVIQVPTDFDYNYNDDYSKMLTELTEDLDRNQLIIDCILATSTNKTALIVSDRKAHCQIISDAINGEMLTGSTPAKERKQIVADVQAGKVKFLISTVQLIGEGFDCAGLDTLYLCTPIKFSGRLKQVLGRILRPKHGKTATVYDFTDDKIGVLKNSARSRKRVFDDVTE